MVVTFLQSRVGKSVCAGAISALVGSESDRLHSASRTARRARIDEAIATNARRLVFNLPEKAHLRLPLLAALGEGLPAPVVAHELACSESYAYEAKKIDPSDTDLYRRAPRDVTVRCTVRSALRSRSALG